MIVRHRFSAESNWNIGFACLMMLLMSEGLVSEGPRFFVSLGFELLALLWVWRNLKYGTVELSIRGLAVWGYGRAVQLQMSDLVAFDSVLTIRGAGHRREVLLVIRSDGERQMFDSVHDRPGSVRMRQVVEELNQSLVRLRVGTAHHEHGR